MSVPAQGPTSPFERSGTADAPPPLPTPGTGGVEELPGQHRPGWAGAFPACGSHSRGDVAASRARVARAGMLIGLLVVVWAMSGGGHFWPVWVMIGWGACLVPDVARLVEHRDARAAASR